MRITRLKATDFRGWADLDLQQVGHVVVLGEPRAGRSDLVAALARVLDPRSTRHSPAVTDIHQRQTESNPGRGARGDDDVPSADEPSDLGADRPGEADEAQGGIMVEVVRAPFAEVEVTLVDLGSDLEQEALGALEPVTEDLQVDDSGDASPDAPFGLRLAYRVTYDSATDALDHLVYYPATSNPAAGQFARVPTAVRLLIPVIFLDASRPLQLRAEGLLRRLLNERDPDAASAALRTLEAQVIDAAGNLSSTAVVSDLLDAVLSSDGPARRAGDRPLAAGDVQFLPDDGTLAGILRAVQPMVALDQAGPLALSSHGSTTTAMLAAAEAMIVAASTQGAIVIGDDFGEGLDSGSAEHLAAAIKSHASQAWLTTRRSEAARAFDVSELVRLTRRVGTRLTSRVATPTNKKEVAAQRHMQSQLLPALTATTVAVVEGRHDLTTFSAADRRTMAPELPLSAHGIRLISADNGGGGGGSQIPRVAALAKSLGFRVVALIDNDPAKKSAEVVTEIEAACDAVVRLPGRMAIERAIIAGSAPADLRAAASVLTEFGQQDPSAGKRDDQLGDAIMRALHSNGLHEPFLAALIDLSPDMPPVLRDALDMVAEVGATDYDGVSRVDLTYEPTTD